MQHYPEQ